MVYYLSISVELQMGDFLLMMVQPLYSIPCVKPVRTVPSFISLCMGRKKRGCVKREEFRVPCGKINSMNVKKKIIRFFFLNTTC